MVTSGHPDIARIEQTGYGTEESDAVCHCCCYDLGIWEGDSYYEIDGEIYCEECLKEVFKRIA